MTEQRVQRRLAAILAADVVGYSALMQRAEEATYAEFERLKAEMAQPVVVDLRNIYRPEDMAAHGFVYESVGRPPQSGI